MKVNIGNFTGEPDNINLKPETKPFCVKLYAIAHSCKSTIRRDVYRLEGI